MPSIPPGGEGALPRTPSMLDLVRLSPRLVFPPGGTELYRHIALLTEMAPGSEVLDVACGKGIPLEYLVREHGVQGSGVDPDPRLVDVAEARCRAGGLGALAQFQQGSPDALPYRDAVFDVAVGELGLAARWDPAAAVAELARVTRPGGFVVLAQLALKAPVDEARRRLLTEHLGARPLMLVEWRRLLADAGVGELHAEEWSDHDTSLRPRTRPFYDFAEVFTLAEKVGVLRRAWARWGLGGVRTVLSREREVHRLLTRERILGLVLLKGRKAPVAAGVSAPPPPAAPGPPSPPPDPAEVEGLPLFSHPTPHPTRSS